MFFKLILKLILHNRNKKIIAKNCDEVIVILKKSIANADMNTIAK